MKTVVTRVCAATMTAALAGMLAAGSAPAKSFEPTRFDDPAPGKCKPRDCSLREAMLAANRREGRDTVILRRGRYEMELPREGLGLSGAWYSDGPLALRGRGPGKTTLDANGLDSGIIVDNVAGASRLKGLRIVGGFAGEGTVGGGGVVTGPEPMTLERVVLARNNSTVRGSGIYSVSRKLTIRRSRIVDNDGALQGGGLYLSGFDDDATATVRDSVVKGNGAALGGGIYSGNPKLTIVRSTISANGATEGAGLDLVARNAVSPRTSIRSSTISGNHASTKGGGILVDGNQPVDGLPKPIVYVGNSTVAANTAAAEAGGVMADNSATVTLDNATVAYNVADRDNAGGGVAGGVYQHSGSGLGLVDSIVAANTVGTTGSGAQCEGFIETSHAVVQTQPSGACSLSGTERLVGSALIGKLARNGGPTRTVKLRSGSPAIRYAGTCPRTDQRGVRRPRARCDAGAFERKRR